MNEDLSLKIQTDFDRTDSDRIPEDGGRVKSVTVSIPSWAISNIAEWTSWMLLFQSTYMTAALSDPISTLLY